MLNLHGLITALITPFNSNGVDILGLRNNIRFQINSGVNGIFVLGSTGEASTLTKNERKEVIKIAVEESKGLVPVFVGTGTNCTKTTFEHTDEAKNLGANCVVIVTPYYNLPSQEGLYRHFQAIHSNCEIPICLYNNPFRSTVKLENETILRLAQLPRIIGLKDSSGNLNKFRELKVLLPMHRNEPFFLMAGDDGNALEFIQEGARGLFSVASNLIPKKMKELIDLALNNETNIAASLLNDLRDLFKGLFLESNPTAVKAAMSLWNMPSGPCRLPLCEISDYNLNKLKNILSEYEELKEPLIEVKASKLDYF